MQFALTSEQEMIAETARGLFAGFAPALRAVMETDAGFDPGQWETAVRDMGLGAMTLSEAEGGAGLGPVEQALVAIEMGRTLYPSPFLTGIGAVLPLLRRAGSDQASSVASGARIAALLRGPSLFLDGESLSGEALSAFAHAAHLLVAAGEGWIALVDPAVARIVRQETMDRTRPLSRVRLDAAPARVFRLGKAVEDGLDAGRILLAAECVGGADAALAATVDYARQRMQFGRPIGSFQALKHRMADMMIAVEAARTAVYYAAAAADEADPLAAEAAAIAHATAIEAYRMVSADMIQLHGGIGFTWEHDAHLHFKRARAAEALFGSPADSRRRLATLIGLDERA